ncbi:MAG: hypothetical protein KGH71_03760 [Candidatus Micrarchaeota archaeon]|nr:hypothetical protein [Candidatus Micrarchaeota archaeon]
MAEVDLSRLGHNDNCPDCKTGFLRENQLNGNISCWSCGFSLTEELSKQRAKKTAAASQTPRQPQIPFKRFILPEEMKVKEPRAPAKPKEEVRLEKARSSVSSLASSLGADPKIREDALGILNKAHEFGLLGKRRGTGMAVASLYLANAENGGNILPKDLISSAKINPTRFRKMALLLTTPNSGGQIVFPPSRFLESTGGVLISDEKVRLRAEEILQRVGTTRLLFKNEPRTLAAASVYISYLEVRGWISQIQLSESSMVSPSAIGKAARKINETLGLGLDARKIKVPQKEESASTSLAGTLTSHLDQIKSNINLEQSIYLRSIELIKIAAKREEALGLLQPKTIAVAIVYLASLDLGVNLTTEKVASSLGVYPLSLSNAAKKINSRLELKITRKRQNISKKRTAKRGGNLIEKLISSLNLDIKLQENARKLFSDATRADIVRRRGVIQVAAASIWISAEQCGVPLQKDALMKASGTRLRGLNTSIRLLYKSAAITQTVPDSKALFLSLGERLALSSEVIGRAEEIMAEFKKLATTSRRISTLVPAATFLAAVDLKVPLSQLKVGSAANLAMISMNKATVEISRALNLSRLTVKKNYYRSTPETTVDILRLCILPSTKAQIVAKVGFGYATKDKLLEKLLTAGLLSRTTEQKKVDYTTTSKGALIVNQFDQIDLKFGKKDGMVSEVSHRVLQSLSEGGKTTTALMFDAKTTHKKMKNLISSFQELNLVEKEGKKYSLNAKGAELKEHFDQIFEAFQDVATRAQQRPYLVPKPLIIPKGKIFTRMKRTELAMEEAIVSLCNTKQRVRDVGIKGGFNYQQTRQKLSTLIDYGMIKENPNSDTYLSTARGNLFVKFCDKMVQIQGGKSIELAEIDFKVIGICSAEPLRITSILQSAKTNYPVLKPSIINLVRKDLLEQKVDKYSSTPKGKEVLAIYREIVALRREGKEAQAAGLNKATKVS